MKQTERPIAVFDSGVGGISVLRELVRLMPNENYIFFGDSKNAPYGGKSLEEVRELTECHVRHLLSEGAKAVVIACNTATSADVSILRKEYPDVPVVGIEPALKPAVQFMEHPRVLVMATLMTIREEKFQRLMARYEKEAEIYPLACPGIVEFVERGELNSADLKAFLYRLLKPYCEGTVDAIVLGCTHYPLLRSKIMAYFGEKVHIVNPAYETALDLKRVLEEQGTANDSGNLNKYEFYVSDAAEKFKQFANSILPYNVETITQINIEEY